MRHDIIFSNQPTKVIVTAISCRYRKIFLYPIVFRTLTLLHSAMTKLHSVMTMLNAIGLKYLTLVVSPATGRSKTYALLFGVMSAVVA